MKVEVVGGPQDGYIYEVSDHYHSITFPVIVGRPVFDEPINPIAAYNETITLDIQRRRDGRHIVVWREI